MKLLDLMINRRSYEITTDDRFLDNGACIQLLTQSKERSHWGKAPSPVLGKGAVKAINKFAHVEHESNYKYAGLKYFGLEGTNN